MIVLLGNVLFLSPNYYFIVFLRFFFNFEPCPNEVIVNYASPYQKSQELHDRKIYLKGIELAIKYAMFYFI